MKYYKLVFQLTQMNYGTNGAHTEAINLPLP